MYACRFELLSGMNGQEGLLMYGVEVNGFSVVKNISIDNGMSKEFTRDYLRYVCQTQIAPQSPHLCAEHIASAYDLEETSDNRQRARSVIDFLSMFIY